MSSFNMEITKQSFALATSRGNGLIQEQMPMDFFKSGTIIPDSIICIQVSRVMAIQYRQHNPQHNPQQSIVKTVFIKRMQYQTFLRLYISTNLKHQQQPFRKQCFHATNILCCIFNKQRGSNSSIVQVKKHNQRQ